MPVAFALLSLALMGSGARAQSQSGSTSVAEAARRTREQKKNAAKPTRTLTNDDLPAATEEAAKPGAVRTAPSGAADQQAKPDTEMTAPEKADVAKESAAQGDNGAKKKAEIQVALKRATAELAHRQRELDVLQRKAALDSDSFYSQTDYARDSEGKAKLDADTQLVNEKKSQVDGLKNKVAALQAEVGEGAEPDKSEQPR